MPHCIIEYSKDLESELSLSNLLSSIFNGAVESNLFNENDIKVRAIAYDHFTSAESRQSFIHVNAKILRGRSLEQRNNLSQIILNELVNIKLESVSLTVEVTEIEKGSYVKYVN